MLIHDPHGSGYKDIERLTYPGHDFGSTMKPGRHLVTCSCGWEMEDGCGPCLNFAWNEHISKVKKSNNTIIPFKPLTLEEKLHIAADFLDMPAETLRRRLLWGRRVEAPKVLVGVVYVDNNRLFSAEEMLSWIKQLDNPRAQFAGGSKEALHWALTTDDDGFLEEDK